MKKWQKVLSGEIQDSGTIKDEVRALTEAGQELEAGLPGLEKDLEKARKALLAESPGAIAEVQKAEKALSENGGKLAAIASILSDLDAALQKALSAETCNRLQEIRSETAKIDKEASEKRDELVTAYAQSCVLYQQLTGQESHGLGYRFFENYNIERLLQNRIEELLPGGPSLHRRRENLQNESVRLQKQDIQ